MPHAKAPALSQAERQRRYRASRDLLSIDIRSETVELISALRIRMGMTTDAVIRTAVADLAAKLDKPRLLKRRKARAPPSATSSPIHKESGRPVPELKQTNDALVASGDVAPPKPNARDNPTDSITGRRRSTKADGPLLVQPDISPLEGPVGSVAVPAAQGTLNFVEEC